MRIIKSLKTVLVATVFAAGAVAGTPAWADRGHDYGRGGEARGHGGGHAYWGWGLGLLAGTAIVLAATEPRPVYYQPPAYVAPPVYVQPPVVMIERTPAVVAPPAQPAYAEQAWWYYCTAQGGYYPYVRTCPSGWTRVSPIPPNQ